MTATPAVAASGTVELEGFALSLALDVPRGTVVGLVGPNGAGKSTTLRTLLGLHRLDTGRITLDGRTVDDGRVAVPPHRRGLGWVPQTPSLLPRRRPVDQVAAFASAAAPLGATPAELLAALDLDPADRRGPARLSGGQAQRVAIARAVGAASTVLLDEPLSSQDGASAARVRTLLRRHASVGGSVLVVAHRPEDAYLLADHLVVLEAGRVVQAGTPAALATAPGSAYVAHVVGATVLEGVVAADGTLAGDWGRLAVPDGTPPGPAVAVVRPQAVVVGTEPPQHSSARNVVAGTVVGLQDGVDAVVVRIDGRPPLVAALTHRAAADLELAVGRRVWATVKASEVDVRPR